LVEKDQLSGSRLVRNHHARQSHRTPCRYLIFRRYDSSANQRGFSGDKVSHPTKRRAVFIPSRDVTEQISRCPNAQLGQQRFRARSDPPHPRDRVSKG